MNLFTFFRVLIGILFCVLQVDSTIIELLRNNVAGPIVNFETVQWPVDPEEGIRRRREYEAINGRLGWKHVERIGLGEDGRTEERRLHQQLRDQIGALSYLPPADV